MAIAKPVGGGVVVRTHNQNTTIQRLYAERRKSADPALTQLQFRLQGTDEVWIVNAGKKG